MNGRNTFTKTHIKHTFNMLQAIPGKNPNIWRKDRDGVLICFPSFGDDNSKYGWNIHHINLDSNVETIDQMFDNLEAISFKAHKAIHANPEELNRIKAVNFVLSHEELPLGGIVFPDDIILNDSEGQYMDNREIAELLMDHIKKGRK